MTKLNKGTRLTSAPLQTENTPSGKTHEGAAGFERDERTELFMRATTVFAGEGSFYEDAAVADQRAIDLVHKLAIEDWAWVKGFLPWLRSEANIRTMSLMLAVEAVYARFETGRVDREDAPALIDAVCQRADEPGEITQYILATRGKFPRRRVLKANGKVDYHYDPIKAGVARAAARLYNQVSVIRWDKAVNPLRFADVIELAHPKPKVAAPDDLDLDATDKALWEISRTEEQSRLFKYLLDQRHHGDGTTRGLYVLGKREELNKLTPYERHRLAGEALLDRASDAARVISTAAARQHEWVMSWLGEGATGLGTALTERERWEIVIPDMGYMALLRNLRNFEQAGLKPSMISKVCNKLASPKEVAESRQLPFRFLSAHLNTHSLKWANALEEGLLQSIQNVPVLGGRTLILIDMSGSMRQELSRPKTYKGKNETTIHPNRIQAAGLFAMALALRNVGRVEVFGFADPPGGHRLYGQGPNPGNFQFAHIEEGTSLLRLMELVVNAVGKVGYGTALEQNLRDIWDPRRYDRVAVFSDEQCLPGGPNWKEEYAYEIGDVTQVIPEDVPVYIWNLAGYTNGSFATGTKRIALAGLTDASFSIMQRIESGRSAAWPWQ